MSQVESSWVKFSQVANLRVTLITCGKQKLWLNSSNSSLIAIFPINELFENYKCKDSIDIVEFKCYFFPKKRIHYSLTKAQCFAENS